MKGYRSGFVGILGRPNVGKSTLLNALCGEKVAIVSDKPQTTRNRILGVRHQKGWQAVFVDTPGMHVWEKALNRYMQKVVADVVSDVDAVIYVVDASRAHGREDDLALGALPKGEGVVPVLLAVNKADLVPAAQTNARLDLLRQKRAFDGLFAISALKGEGITVLMEAAASFLPEGVPYFPEDMVTDQPLGFQLSEIVREKVFAATRDEVPFSTAVVVEDILTRDDGLLEVNATIYVEKESQKGIVIGEGGKLLKKVGTAARQEMERKLGKKVFLRLWVKVMKGWTDRDSLMRKLGYR